MLNTIVQIIARILFLLNFLYIFLVVQFSAILFKNLLKTKKKIDVIFLI